MRIARHVSELIGNTPLVELNSVVPEGAGRVLAKVEYLNPGGSVKDRICAAMIEAAEREGRLKPGDTIVEPTSGNTGIGLALVAAVKGYRLILVMPETMSMERRVLLLAFGAELVLTPGPNGMKGAIAKARELATVNPGAFVALQFENPANPEYHHDTTAKEIYEQMDGKVDAIVAGVGTGGTFTGIARFMKERRPGVHCVAVETQGSVLQGGQPGPHKVEGIGVSFIPGTFDAKVADEIIMVSDADAFDMVKQLAAKEGILGGSSAGANMFAALRVAKKLGKGKRVVTIAPDSAERYMSKKIFEGGI